MILLEKYREVLDFFILLLGIGFLFVLIVKYKISSFLSLLLTAIVMGFALSMDAQSVSNSITKGIGSTLGSLAVILTIGSMLGRLMADSGAAQRIALSIIHRFGKKNVRWSICFASSLVGFALFYEVGFILLIPIVFTIARQLNINPLETGIPMAAALSVTHGFLPPHPGPVLIADILGADLGMVLAYGCIIAAPVFVIAGPIFYSFVRNIRPVSSTLYNLDDMENKNLPSFFTSIVSTLVPILFMLIATIVKIFSTQSFHNTPIYAILNFLGNPNIALLVSIFLAIYILGIRMGRSMQDIGRSLESGIKEIAGILLIIAAGGALKQVLVESGLSDTISYWIGQSSFSPLFLAWLVAAVFRIALGSASVAAITAGGIVLPMSMTLGVNIELMVLAIGAGSVILSLPNDPGFWMFKEFFHLSIKQTLLTWSLLETIIACSGLAGVLVLNAFLS